MSFLKRQFRVLKLAFRVGLCILVAAVWGILLSACHEVRVAGGSRADTPEKLLRAILDCSRNRDYERVKRHIYPMKVYPNLTTQDAAIMYMKEGRLSHMGDFSYSDAAMEIILNSHLQRFTSHMDASWLRPVSKGGLIDDELRRTTAGDPRHFLFLDHQGCHILLVQLEGEFKLLFWEGMNFLLGSRK